MMLRLLLVRLRFMGAPGTILSSRATLDTSTTTVTLNLGYTKHIINTSKLESVVSEFISFVHNPPSSSTLTSHPPQSILPARPEHPQQQPLAPPATRPAPRGVSFGEPCWKCSSCQLNNWPEERRCTRCSTPSPAELQAILRQAQNPLSHSQEAPKSPRVNINVNDVRHSLQGTRSASVIFAAMKAAQPKILPWICPQSQCNRFNGSGVNTCRDCDLAWSPDIPPPSLGKPPKESCHRFWRTGECNDAKCVLKHIGEN